MTKAKELGKIIFTNLEEIPTLNSNIQRLINEVLYLSTGKPWFEAGENFSRLWLIETEDSETAQISFLTI